MHYNQKISKGTFNMISLNAGCTTIRKSLSEPKYNEMQRENWSVLFFNIFCANMVKVFECYCAPFLTQTEETR